jgi:dTDP-4-dehydrorhamnose reductase
MECRHRRMKIVIIGSGGRLGAALMREFAGKFDVTGFNHIQLDLANAGEIQTKIDKLDFDFLINAAAFTNVDLCESKRDEAFRVNGEAPRLLAEICAKKNSKLIHFSTDYVFDGKKREPYREEDPAHPISVYGESKRAGEENVLAIQDRHLVVRVSWVFGPDRPSFIDSVIKRARESEQVDAIADKFAAPTYTRDIAQMLLKVVAGVADPGPAAVSDPGYNGILHFSNTGECSWQQYAQHAFDCCHQLGVPLKAKTVAPLKLADMKNFIARRPVYSVLSTAKYASLSGMSPRPWRDAVAEYVRDFVAS